MATIGTDDRGRALAIAGVVLVHAALGLALLRGLGVSLPRRVSDGLTVLNVLPPPPPPPRDVERRHRISPRREGAASPPNLRAKPTEVVAPKPILPPPVPPPLPAAPVAGTGLAPSAGAAPEPGPGTGSGGIGNGTGNGGSGNGDGGGGGTPEELVSGHVSYPHGVPDRHVDEEVGLRFTVGVKGRVTDCVVTASSGNPPLDAVTCDLIRRKLRYRPARDAGGRPVPAVVVGTQTFEYRGERDGADARDGR